MLAADSTSSARVGLDPTSRPRVRALDVLRGIAVLLVLGRHMPLASPEAAHLPMPVWHVLRTWHHVGWVGVDLFFVLSGYLIGGLLFEDARRHGRVRVGRFLVRRGFKIYPGFYAMLLAGLAVTLARGGTIPWPQLAAEVAFLQNYRGGVWPHTWSLGVEEHFYLLLAVAAWWWGRQTRAARSARALVGCGALLALSTLGLRWWNARTASYTDLTHLFPTHLRIDALMLGVVLAYVIARHPGVLAWAGAHRRRLGLLTAVCAGPAVLLPVQAPFMHTVGLTLLSMSASAVILLAQAPRLEAVAAMRSPGPASGLLAAWFARGLAAVGTRSYAIYLWHFVAFVVMQQTLITWHASYGFTITYRRFLAGYLLSSLALGWAAHQWIERPMLRLRDRLAP